MAARERHKGRKHWTRWSGTPSLIAEIVALARKLTAADHESPAEVHIKVVASAWESELTSEEHLLTVDASDLQDIELLDVKTNATGGRARRNITLTFKRPVEWRPRDAPAPKVVSLNVAGPDRHWVEDATAQMSNALTAGVPGSAKMRNLVGYSAFGVLVLGVILAISGSSGDVHWLKVLGLVLMGVGGAVVVVAVLSESILPRLEILPEGTQTRRSRALRWARREAAWLTRNVFLIVLGIGLTLLVQRLT